MDSDTSQQFQALSVNFTKETCTDGFSELSSTSAEKADWSGGLCLGAATQLCLATDTTELVRIVIEFSGALTMSAALHIDGSPVAWIEKEDWKDRGIVSTTQTVDALLLLSGGCKTLLVVYDDGISTDAQLDGDHVQKVCACSFF